MRVSIFHELVYPYSRGGGEIQRYQIARYLAGLGNDVTLIGYKYPGKPERETVGNLRIRRAGIFPVRDAHQNLPRLPDAISMFFVALSEKYDIMMSNPYFSLPVTLPLAKLFGKPVAVTWDDVFGYETFRNDRGGVLSFGGAVLEKLCIFLTRYADVIFTVSMSTKQKLIKRGIEESRIVVMRSGVNIEDYPGTKAKKKNQIVYIGRHLFYKNVDHLIKAFAEISKKKKHIRLVILGYGTLTEYYKKIAKDLGVDNRIEFRGFVSQEEKIRVLRESLFLVLPSSFEGFGLVLIEANICRTPYVAYDIPAVNEVTAITKGGILVKEGNITALSQAIEKLLSDRRLRETLAKNGAKNVSEKLTWKAVAEIVNKNLKKLVV